MSNASSRFTEPYAAWRSDRSQSNSNTPGSIHPSATNPSAINQSAINQSPEQHFEMSLLPGHRQPLYSPLATGRMNQALAGSFVTKSFAAQTEAAQRTSHVSAEITALQQQQAAMCDQIQQQERITSERLKGFRYQLDRQEKRHQDEIRRLTNEWKQQLATLGTYQADSAQAGSTQPDSAQRLEQYKPQYKKSPLQGVPPTYRVPNRVQSRRIDSILGAVPVFIWLVMLGIGMAGASAIALSPAVLWPSLSIYIRAAIPILFVTGLLGLGITTVWNTFR